MSYRNKLSELGITLNETGRQTCPQCSHNRKEKNKTDKCLSVQYKDDGVLYNCHNNCGFTGFIRYEDKTIMFSKFKKEYVKPEPKQNKSEQDALYRYFAKRKIDKKTVDDFGVTLGKKNEIYFNYYKQGELVNVKTRINTQEGKRIFYQEKDSEETFFGMDLIPTDCKELIIVEGEVDAMSFYQQGFYAVSIPQGASDRKMEYINNCYPFLEGFDNFIIAVDNDKAGEGLKFALIERLGSYRCKVIDWSLFGVKDANEALLKDHTVLRQAISCAEQIPVDGIETFIDHKDSILDYHANGYSSGISTGWKNLDYIFKIKTGHLMIVTGIPTRGKSFFIDNMLFNLAMREGWKHLICTMENTVENHFSRFAQMYKRKPFSGNLINGMNKNDIENSLEVLSEVMLRLAISKSWTIDEILEKAEYAIKRYGIKSLVIDPYNRLNNQFDGREDKYIDSILSKLSMFCKKHNILIIFIAHPTKLPKDEKRPTMYSISGGSAWYNMADYGIVIHRDRDNTTQKLEDVTQVIVEKVKDFHIGRPEGGIATLKYNRERFCLEDVLTERKTGWL